MKLFLSIVLFTVILSAYAQDEKYCDPQLCGNDIAGRPKPHIACPGVAVNKCPSDARQTNIDGALQQSILNTYNSYRNELAGGSYSHLPSAIRMPTLEWDDELAYIAGKNAMQCIVKYEKCRKTYIYQYSGQTVCGGEFEGSDEEFFNACLKVWWDEYWKATKKDIEHIGLKYLIIFNFMQMSQDRTNRVGCASVQFNGYQRIFTCNYAFTNILGSYVYKTGSPGNGCTTGSNSQYRNLCSTNELINPVPKTGEAHSEMLKIDPVIIGN